MYLFKVLILIVNVGLRFTISTGSIFNPTYQERTYIDLVQQESNKYKRNFNYSTEKYISTFILK